MRLVPFLLLGCAAARDTPRRQASLAFSAGTDCTGSEGAWNCLTSQFQRCVDSEWTALQGVAAGTMCTPAGLTFNFHVVALLTGVSGSTTACACSSTPTTTTTSCSSVTSSTLAASTTSTIASATTGTATATATDGGAVSEGVGVGVRKVVAMSVATMAMVFARLLM